MGCWVTPEQEYILSILQKTKILRKRHAYRLLYLLNGRNERYADRCLEQLRFIRKIEWKTEDVFTLPLLYGTPTDEEMLWAVDIMLDLTDFKIPALSVGRPPYKLCFLTEQDNSIGSYAVVIVPPGQEASVTDSLHLSKSVPKSRTVIFLLSNLSQRGYVKTTLPHFFAIHDGSKYRYFEGGGIEM